MKHLLLAFFSLVLFSCETAKTNTELNSCKDNALAEVIYLDVYKQSQIYLNLFLSKQSPSDTAIKFISTANPNSIAFPFVLTVQFGNKDLLGSDNKFRRGAMILTVNAASDDGTMLSIDQLDVTFEDFYLNQSNVLGTITLVNNGKNTKNNYSFNLNVSKGIVINSNGTMSWESLKTLEMTAGASTRSNILDDTYLLSGSASGKDFKLTDYSTNIATPMTIDPNCRWFISAGITTVEPNNLDVRNVNYGLAGNCTGQVEVQIKEQSLNFSMQ